MIIRALQAGLAGKLFCSTCYQELERDEKLVGLVSGAVYDIYRCSRCSVIHWAAKPPTTKRMAS